MILLLRAVKELFSESLFFGSPYSKCYLINYDLEMTSFDLLKYHPDLPQITVVQVLSGNAHDDAFKLEIQMQHFPLSYIMRSFLSLSSYCNSTLSK